MINEIVNEIVKETNNAIKNVISEKLLIDFVDIFPKDEVERKKLLEEIKKVSKLIDSVKTGEIFRLNIPIKTIYGPLNLIKIRIYDETRTQRGAPDFKVNNYEFFKKKYNNLKVIIRKEYEMIEFKTEKVLIYFPNETLSESLAKK
ncbi:MAG: hypothetical protein WC376_01505 [Candidatus Nanoarchaeia archaeon]|jgi:hypothetical protein